MRTMYGKFSVYHTSGDHLDFVKPEFLSDTFSKYVEIIFELENNQKFQNIVSKCEPQLGKRKLYDQIGGAKRGNENDLIAIQWILNMSDGTNTLLDISEKSNLPFIDIKNMSDKLLEANLLEPIK